MGFFTQQTRTVQLDEENSVVVRKLTYAERQSVIDMATTVGASMEPTIHVGRMKAEMLYLAVVSWAGPDFEGRPATHENIGALPPAIADAIAEAADALQDGLDEDEKKA